MIAELAECIHRLRGITPDVDLVIVTSPTALHRFAIEHSLSTLTIDGRNRLLGLDIVTREDAPPGQMYVMERRYA